MADSTTQPYSRPPFLAPEPEPVPALEPAAAAAAQKAVAYTRYTSAHVDIRYRALAYAVAAVVGGVQAEVEV
jgi:hypothetical protein